MSAPLSGGLELRLEHSKRLSNLRLEFLKRLYDGLPVVERYLQGKVELHVHFLARDRMLCARYFSRQIEKLEPLSVSPKLDLKSPLVKSEVSMFVGVGDIPQFGRPITSSVRLHSLNSCYMSGIEAVEPSTIFPPLEALSLIFNRKLSAINNLPGIEDSKLIDEIIEGGTKVVANLADDDAKIDRNRNVPMHDELRFAEMLRVCIPSPATGLFLFVPEGFDSCYKIKNVFLCPSRSGNRTV